MKLKKFTREGWERVKLIIDQKTKDKNGDYIKGKQYEFLKNLINGDYDDDFFCDENLVVDQKSRVLPELDLKGQKGTKSWDGGVLGELAISLYEPLKDLGEINACDDLLWNYLNLCVYRDFIFDRRGVEKKNKDYSQLENHWIYKNQSAAQNARTDVCSLWWGVHQTINKGVGDKYKYTRLLFSKSDIFLQITDRRQIFSESATIKGVLDFIGGFDVKKRTSRLREIVVYFHNHIKLFDTQFLEAKDISSLCENFYLDYQNKRAIL
tara:strand:+ start:188 stop:985 length:798 start_codon:yes stop_codon:yes gene_type:complete